MASIATQQLDGRISDIRVTTDPGASPWSHVSYSYHGGEQITSETLNSVWDTARSAYFLDEVEEKKPEPICENLGDFLLRKYNKCTTT